jgi:hypothetical protein
MANKTKHPLIVRLAIQRKENAFTIFRAAYTPSFSLRAERRKTKRVKLHQRKWGELFEFDAFVLSIDAMEKVYPGTNGGKTNDRRKSIENYLTQKLNHCTETTKKWLRKYKPIKYKLAHETAKE